MDIYYYLDGAQYAYRGSSQFIPRVGDEIRLKMGLYSIVRVVWIEDKEPRYVAIDIKPVDA